MKDRVHLFLVALVAVVVGLSFLQEPGFGDDLTYWTQGLEVHERGAKAWERASFHDLRWPVWGVCWALQQTIGFGVVSFYGEPLLYLALGAMLAFGLGRTLLTTAAAGWACAIAFLFHPLLDSVCFRPMPDLSEGVLGAAVMAAWWKMMNASRATLAWMLATGVLVFVVESNRVTGAFIVPVLIVCTLAHFPRRFGWLVGAGAVAAVCYTGEAALYHSLFGDWLHNLHANMNNTGNKGTEPIPLWTLPFRFFSSVWKPTPVAPVYCIFAGIYCIVAIASRWTRWIQPSRFATIVIAWFWILFFEYSCMLQPVWPLRPMLRDADRFLAAVAIPMSLLAVSGLWWVWARLWVLWKEFTGREPIRIPTAALAAVGVLTLWASTTRSENDSDSNILARVWQRFYRSDFGFVPEYRAYLRSLPAGTKVFTHESMRAIAILCDADAVARLSVDAPNRILLSTPDLEQRAAQASEFWYARKLVWLTARKGLERGAPPKQPALGSYFDSPEREWTLTRLLAKGDTPDLIFYRRRTPESPAPQVLGMDAPEFRELLPALPVEWTRATGPKELTQKWKVPPSIRGKYVRLEAIASSAQPEAFTLRLKFKQEADEVAEFVLKPYLHRDGGKEFFVFPIPANADRCDVTLKFSTKADSVRVESVRAVFEQP